MKILPLSIACLLFVFLLTANTGHCGLAHQLAGTYDTTCYQVTVDGQTYTVQTSQVIYADGDMQVHGVNTDEDGDQARFSGVLGFSFDGVYPLFWNSEDGRRSNGQYFPQYNAFQILTYWETMSQLCIGFKR